jgi:hypothetical protein
MFAISARPDSRIAAGPAGVTEEEKRCTQNETYKEQYHMSPRRHSIRGPSLVIMTGEYSWTKELSKMRLYAIISDTYPAPPSITNLRTLTGNNMTGSVES